jgi:hypothetical protein
MRQVNVSKINSKSPQARAPQRALLFTISLLAAHCLPTPAQESEVKLPRQLDFSRQFTYSLPDKWKATRVPTKTNDILQCHDGSIYSTTINFSEAQTSKLHLGANFNEIEENFLQQLKDNLDSVKVESKEELTLKSGKTHKLICTATKDKESIRFLTYFLDLGSQTLNLTLCSQCPDNRYDGVMEALAQSIEKEKKEPSAKAGLLKSLTQLKLSKGNSK